MMQGSLAERLRILRARRGLNLTDAAQRTGVTRHTLAALERGGQEPHFATLAKLAEGYGVSVEDLLEEPVPLDEAPPETGHKVPMPGTAGEHIEVRIHSDLSDRQAQVEIVRTPFLDLFRKVSRGQLSPEEATKRALRLVS